MDRELMIFIMNSFYNLSAGIVAEALNDPFKLFKFGEFKTCHKYESDVVDYEKQTFLFHAPA